MFSFHALSRKAGLEAQFDAVAEVDASVIGVAQESDAEAEMYEAIELAVGANLVSGRAEAVAAEVFSVIARYAHVFVYSRPDQVIIFQPEVGGAIVEYRRFGDSERWPLQCLLGHEMTKSDDGPGTFRLATAASFDEDFAEFYGLLEDYFALAPSKRRPFLEEMVQRRTDRSDAALIAGELSLYGPAKFWLCAEQCGLIKYWQHWYASQSAIAALDLCAKP